MNAAQLATRLQDPDFRVLAMRAGYVAGEVCDAPALERRIRAVRVLDLVRETDWVIEFTATSPRARAHVIAHPETWPTYENVVDALLHRRWMTVCGRQIRRRMERLTEWVVDDRRICPDCHAAFPGDSGSVIFEHNTPEMQERAGGNYRIARDLLAAPDEERE